MGMRSLFPASLFVSPRSLRPARRRVGALAVAQAAGTVVESLETRVLFAATITATITPVPAALKAGATVENVTVVYVDSDVAGLPMTGFAGTNLSVSGPSAATVTLNGAVTQAAGTATAAYIIHAPGGANWNPSENGTYTIGLNAGVTDTAADTVMPTSNTFAVAIGPSAAVTAPATVTAAGSTPVNVVVTYTDTNGLDVLGSTLGTGNITVNGPSGAGSTSLTVASATVTPLVSTSPTAAMYVVTYSVDAPAGGWSISNGGTYTIGIVGNVTDNGSPAVSGAANAAAATFLVNVTDAPTAVLTPPGEITAAGGNIQTIIVTYSDPGASLGTPVLIKGTTINATDISVTTPSNTQLTIAVTSPLPPVANGSPIVVTYTATLPAGQTWNAGLNGTYTIALAGVVQNTLNNAITANPAFGTFAVGISDSNHPTATVSAPPLLQSISNTHPIVVTYVSDSAISTASVTAAGTSAITVIDNATAEALDVVGETIAAGTATNPKILPVTYTLQPPSGNNFSAADNGTYTIALVGAPAVTDTSGNPVLPIPNLGTFVIDIGDVSRPSATVMANDVTSNGPSGETITFILTSGATVSGNGQITGSPINVSTITLDSLSVVGPNGAALAPKSLSLSSAINAATVTAIYVVAPPNGQAFRGVDNGAYTISLNGVSDTQGLSVLPSSVSSSFTVDVGEPQTLLHEGQFGIFNGKEHKLHFYDVPLGASVTISGKGGTGDVYQEDDGSLSMTITDFGGGVSVNVQTGGNRPVNFRNVVVNGSLTNFQAVTGNLEGVFQVSGTLAKATFRQLVGTLVASGPILNLKVLRAVTDSQILSGVLFGADGLFGANPNTLVDDDTYAPGTIDNISVGGAFTDSVVAAGANPGPDKIFGENQITQTDDDIRAGTFTSVIEHITAVGSDGLTRFEAGHYGTFKFHKKTFFPDPAADNRFKGL